MSAIEITPGRMTMSNGKFDTNNRYIRRPANSATAQFWMTQGRTIAVAVVKNSPSAWAIGFRFEVGPLGYALGAGAYLPAAGFAVDRPVVL